MADSRGTKYTLFPKCSVGLYSETVGCPNLSDSVKESLAEDVTYKIKETIQNATRVMKHCKRRCMTTGDFATALKWSDNQLIYGHNGIDVSHFKSFTFKDKNISYIEDKDLHLRETAFDQTLPADPGEVSLKGNQTKDENSNREVLEEPYASFMQRVISSIFGSNVKAKKLAVETVQTSNKLQTMLPYLVTFLASQVKSCNGNNTLKNIARGTLLIVEALVENTSLFLIPYVLQIVKLLLFIIMDGHLPISFWECKLSAARILTQLCRRHMSTMNYLPHHLLKAYQEHLNDESKSIGSFYGAAYGISCLGAEPTHQVLYPVMISKCKKLKETLSTTTDLSVIQESLMLYGLLQDLSVFLLRTAASTSCLSNTKSGNRSSSNSCYKYFAIYSELLNVFDDGIVALTQFPNLQSGNPTLYPSKHLLAKQEQNSKNVLNLEISSIKKEQCDFDSRLFGSSVNESYVNLAEPIAKSMHTQVNSNLVTPLGIIKSQLKWRKRPIKAALESFNFVNNEFSDEGPSKAKKRKLDDSQPLIRSKPAEKRDFMTVKVIQRPRINLVDLAKVPVTLNIFW